MQFNSYIFIFVFLPVLILLFFTAARYSKRAADILLLFFSIVFYAYDGWRSLLVVAVDVVINALLAKALVTKKNKALLASGIIMNSAAILLFRSFWGVLGISFISFQMIAILVETYKGFDVTEGKDRPWLIDFFTYALYFPKIISGPLVNPQDFFEKLKNDNRYKADFDNMANGFILFSIGAFKKVLVGDTFMRVVNWGFANFDSATSMDWVFVIFAYMFQAYFDFSGYCDMAGGVSLMLNLELPLNFDSPLKSYSVPEFWTRWHITLYDFLRKYLYFPLGGSRKGTFRTYLNIMIIFAVSGLWHGQSWNFVLWGISFGIICVIYRLIRKWYEKLHHALKWIINYFTFCTVVFLARCESVTQWFSIIKKVFLPDNLNVSEGLARSVFLVETETLLDFFGLGFLNYMPVRFLLVLFIGAFAVCLGCDRAYGKKFKLGIPMIVFTSVLFITAVISIGSGTSFFYQRF